MERPYYTKTVEQRIEAYNDGTVFSISDFADIADAKTIHMILKRISGNGKIIKLLRGVYYKPKYSKMLNERIPPRINDIADTIARSYGWNIIPSKATVLNLLGLSTQVPAKYEFISDGPYKTYEYNGINIEFKHTNKNTELTKISKKSAIIIQALKAIGKENINEAIIQKLKESLSKEERKLMLKETMHCTSWVYEVIKIICKEEKNV